MPFFTWIGPLAFYWQFILQQYPITLLLKVIPDMKKNIVTLFTLALVILMVAAAYRTLEATTIPRTDTLVRHKWTFHSASSADTEAASIVNTLYSNSHYNFESANTYTGRFFDRNITGTWIFEGQNRIVLNKGSWAEEVFEIKELSNEVLRIATLQKGHEVTLTYQ